MDGQQVGGGVRRCGEPGEDRQHEVIRYRIQVVRPGSLPFPARAASLSGGGGGRPLPLLASHGSRRLAGIERAAPRPHLISGCTSRGGGPVSGGRERGGGAAAGRGEAERAVEEWREEMFRKRDSARRPVLYTRERRSPVRTVAWCVTLRESRRGEACGARLSAESWFYPPRFNFLFAASTCPPVVWS